ncbi:sortase [Patescibacteria group bacterium]|nr:sortase [Patescibacteria group bacterium]
MTHKGAIREVGERRGAFALAFIAIFILTFVFLRSVGVTPDPIHPQVIDGPITDTQENPATVSAPQMPVRVVAKDVGLDATIANPVSTDVEVLDQALLKGSVRYPTSAQLGVDGTVLLFGHSSYLPVVHNQAYKAFDDIQKLKTGQIIHVYSSDIDYQYSVVGVKVADANQDSIELTPQGKHLTLVTCDSFSTKSNRFIVTADFVGAYSIVSN